MIDSCGTVHLVGQVSDLGNRRLSVEGSELVAHRGRGRCDEPHPRNMTRKCHGHAWYCIKCFNIIQYSC